LRQKLIGCKVGPGTLTADDTLHILEFDIEMPVLWAL
jgi:hypothetical protein